MVGDSSSTVANSVSSVHTPFSEIDSSLTVENSFSLGK